MVRRRLLVAIPREEYRRLAELAEREDRAVDQQASYLLRQALERLDGSGHALRHGELALTAA